MIFILVPERTESASLAGVKRPYAAGGTRVAPGRMAVGGGGCSQQFQPFPGSPGDGSNTITAAPRNSCTAGAAGSLWDELGAFGMGWKPLGCAETAPCLIPFPCRQALESLK